MLTNREGAISLRFPGALNGSMAGLSNGVKRGFVPFGCGLEEIGFRECGFRAATHSSLAASLTRTTKTYFFRQLSRAGRRRLPATAGSFNMRRT